MMHSPSAAISADVWPEMWSIYRPTVAHADVIPLYSWLFHFYWKAPLSHYINNFVHTYWYHNHSLNTHRLSTLLYFHPQPPPIAYVRLASRFTINKSAVHTYFPLCPVVAMKIGRR